MPDPANPESEPPVTETSDWVKLVDASLSVNVIVAVWPALSVVGRAETATVGTTVLMVIGVDSDGGSMTADAVSTRARSTS